MPAYDDLIMITVNVFLLFPIATKSLTNIFVTYNLILMSILNNLFQVFFKSISILFFKFCIVLPYTALFINLCNTFPSLLPFFSASTLFCALNSTYGFSLCD